MNKLYLAKHVVEIPENWQELNREQILKITQVLHSKLSVREAQLRVLKILLKLTWNQRFLFRFRTDFDQKNQMLMLTDWVFEEVELLKNPFPTLKKFRGPDDECRNLRFWEFCNADMMYMKFMQTKQIEYLDKLIAILWRREDKEIDLNSPDYEGDIRERYSDYNLEHRIEKLSRIKQVKKQTILLFWHSCRKLIIENHPDVFDSKNNSGKKNEFGWAGVLHAIAENPLKMREV